MSEIHTLEDGTIVHVGDVLIYHGTVDLPLPWLAPPPQGLAEDFRDEMIAKLRERGIVARQIYLNASDSTGNEHDVFFDVELEIVEAVDIAARPLLAVSGQLVLLCATAAVVAVSSALWAYNVRLSVESLSPATPLAPGEETVGTHIGDNIESTARSGAVIALAGAAIVLVLFLWSKKQDG